MSVSFLESMHGLRIRIQPADDCIDTRGHDPRVVERRRDRFFPARRWITRRRAAFKYFSPLALHSKIESPRDRFRGPHRSTELPQKTLDPLRFNPVTCCRPSRKGSTIGEPAVPKWTEPSGGIIHHRSDASL